MIDHEDSLGNRGEVRGGGAQWDVVTPPQESALAYVYGGAVLLEGKPIASANMLVAGKGDRWTLAAAEAGASVLLLRGESIREPVANYGPFVMNTMEEIDAAIRDYQNGELVRSGGEQ